MRRSIVSFSLLLLAACGVGPESYSPSTASEAPLTPSGVEGATLSLAPLPLQRLRSDQPEVLVHSLAAPDGAEVHYLLGVMSCGLFIVAQGTATVHGGTFVVPYEAAAAGNFEQVSLYFQVTAPGERCQADEPVLEVQTALPASIDLSVVPEPGYAGCWLFDFQQP